MLGIWRNSATYFKKPFRLTLRTWIVICLFGVNAIFTILLFFIVVSSLEENLLERTKDQLNSVNILKTRLLYQVLSDQQTETFHIIQFHESHHSDLPNFMEALSAVEGVKKISFNQLEKASVEQPFYACTDFQGKNYTFNYSLDTGAVRIDFDYHSLTDVLKERTGLGTTGESYLVGENQRMISQSIFFPEKSPQDIECKSLGSELAMSGKVGLDVYTDYREVKVIGAYRLISFNGIRLAILTEMDYQEAMNPILEIRNRLSLILLLMLILALIASTFIADIFVKPVQRLKSMADKLTLGILPSGHSSNELVYEFSVIIRSMNKLVDALKSTVEFAQNIGKGNMEESFSPLSDKDELGSAVSTMREQLLMLDKEKLELERKSKLYLIEGQEKERERIARDLHDGMGSLLTTMKLKMGTYGILENRSDLKALLDQMIEETRSLARNLMPAVLMDFGLNEALSQLINTNKQSTDIDIRYSYDKEEEEFTIDKNRQVYIYRIAQEVLHNAIKHSKCTEIWLSLTEFEDFVLLYIKDNGKGIVNDEKKEGLGFKNIRERAKLLNGNLYIESDKTGTSIEIKIPAS